MSIWKLQEKNITKGEQHIPLLSDIHRHLHPTQTRGSVLGCEVGKIRIGCVESYLILIYYENENIVYRKQTVK
jgi:hypothetical protein